MSEANERNLLVSIENNQVVVTGNTRFNKGNTKVRWIKSESDAPFSLYMIAFGVTEPLTDQSPIRNIDLKKANEITAQNNNRGGEQQIVPYALFLRKDDGRILHSPCICEDEDPRGREEAPNDPPLQLENEPNGNVGKGDEDD